MITVIETIKPENLGEQNVYHLSSKVKKVYFLGIKIYQKKVTIE